MLLVVYTDDAEKKGEHLYFMEKGSMKVSAMATVTDVKDLQPAWD